MPIRLPLVAAAIATLCSCAVPRAAIATGAAAAIVGAFAIAASPSHRPPDCPDQALGCLIADGISTDIRDASRVVLGGALLTAAATLLIAGAIGLSRE
jgi:hypothetical protein